MDRKKRKSKTLTYPTVPSSSRRRCQCRRRRREDLVDEWRDWASLHRDVLCIVLGKLTQTDILRGAGLVCSPWRRLAMHEPLLWRHVDLCSPSSRRLAMDKPLSWPLWYGRVEQPPAGWKAMARTALDRSAGRCESFSGHIDEDVLVHLANRAPLLRSLDVAHWPWIKDEQLITRVIKKLPLLERLVISRGFFQEEMLVALLDHCPRLELLDATYCRPTFRVWEEPIASRIKSCTIKNLRRPRVVLF